MDLSVDVTTTTGLTLEQVTRVHETLFSIVSRPEYQAELDQLEIKAKGDIELYSRLLNMVLRCKAYPELCKMFGIPSEQEEAGIQLLFKSMVWWSTQDIGIAERWLKLETLMRNKLMMKHATKQLEIQARREGARQDKQLEKYTIGMIMKILTGDSKVNTLANRGEESRLVNVDGQCGQVIDCNESEESYTIQTFEGLIVRVHKDKLEVGSLDSPAVGGSDFVYDTSVSPEDFGRTAADWLAHQGFCMVQMSESKATRDQATDTVFDVCEGIDQTFRQEIETAYLGMNNKTEVKALPPDMTNDNALGILSEQVLSSLKAVSFFTEEYFGYDCWAATSVWARVSEEADDVSDFQPLSEKDVVEGMHIRAYDSFILGRKMCAIYLVDNAGGEITLFPRIGSSLANAGVAPITIELTSNKMLIFRHDQMSYSYQPRGPSLALQCWLLTDIPLAKLNMQTTPLTGVKEPPAGENAQVMSLETMMPAESLGEAALWNMFSTGTDAASLWPAARMEVEPYYTAGDDYMQTGKSYTCHGSFLCGDAMFSFDNSFFGVDEAEAQVWSPGQHHVAETGYSCLYKAGHTQDTLAGENMGVFLGDSGMDWHGYAAPWTFMQHGKVETLKLCHGIHVGTTAGRLSQMFDLRGPVQTADTACSSSLVALQASHKAMMHKNTDAASMQSIGAPHSVLNGGVNLIMFEGMYIGSCMAGMLSHTGRCFTYDRTADGYQRGEGNGFMFIKWSSSIMDLEERFACLVSSCSGHDGRSASLTAPNGPAQQDIIRRSMRMAGVDPSLISVCECHGTGTALGDPIEIGSLQGVMRGMRTFPLINTSAKSNISHLEPAAGIAGIVKCVLMVMHSCGPPNCHLRSVNQNLITEGYPVFFQQELCDTTFSTTFIGVSSFGYGGTNSRADVYGRCLYGARNTGNCFTDQRRETRDLAYAHGLRQMYKGFDKLDQNTVPKTPISIIGSWDNFRGVHVMRQQEPGCFTYRMTLGSTRQECFQLCMGADRSKVLYPAADKSSSTALICFTEDKHSNAGRNNGRNNKWLVNGLSDAAHEGTTYCITFRWQGEKSITWEPDESEAAITNEDAPANEFYICDSTSRWEPRKMSCFSEEHGLYDANIEVDSDGVAKFYIRRANDTQQTIYPHESASACGPGKNPTGKHFEIQGANGQTMKVRLSMQNKRLSVTVLSERGIERSWASTHIQAYYVTGSFNGWKNARMHEDRFLPRIYKYYMVVQQDEPVDYKIVVDVDWSREVQGLSAAIPFADTAVMDGIRDFKGRVGSAWEIVLDLNQDDPRRMMYSRPATSAEVHTVSTM